jgi:hypothetical protein
LYPPTSNLQPPTSNLQPFCLSIYQNTLMDYCSTDPKPCQKNLGIPRIQMPQIDTPTDFRLLKSVVKDQLGCKGKIQYLNLRSSTRNKVFASQKEINTEIAQNIATPTPPRPTRPTRSTRSTRPKNPVILLHDPKEDEYLVVDGHHRWLAHHLHPKTMKPKMRSYVIELSDLSSLEAAFHQLNQALRDHRHVHFKRIKPQKAKPQKAKPQKAKHPKAKPQKAKPQKAKPPKIKNRINVKRPP